MTAGQQSTDHGRAVPARRGVRGHADRLVHHQDVVVLVDDVQALHGAAAALTGRGAGSVTSSGSPAATRSDLAAGCPPTSTEAVADQLGGPGPGQAEHPGQGGVEPLTVEPLGNRQITLAGSVIRCPAASARRSGDGRSWLGSAGLGQAGAGLRPGSRRAVQLRQPRRGGSRTASTPPQTMAESARLNTGQCGNSIQSTTSPRNSPGERKIRSARFPVAPPSSRPERDRPRQAAQLAGAPGGCRRSPRRRSP